MEIENMIREVRTNYAIVEIRNDCGLLKGTPYKAIVTPHRRGHVSQLTMGNYYNYTHTELYPVKFPDQIRIHQCTVHNNHVSTGSCSYPYTGNILHIPAADQAAVKELLNQLIATL